MSIEDIKNMRIEDMDSWSITREELERFAQARSLDSTGPWRICFETTHGRALKEYREKYPWTFSVPFSETIRSIFESQTELVLYQSRIKGIPDELWNADPNEFGSHWRSQPYWCGLSNDEKKRIEEWMHDCGTLVFLRDLLSLSIALSEGKRKEDDQDWQRTKIGDLEYRAKSKNDQASILKLANLAKERIDSLPFYKGADLIIPAPVSPDKINNLPSSVAKIIAASLDKPFCPILRFENRGQQMKDIEFDEKLKNLDERNLLIKEKEVNSLTGKTVILLDDKYQSGLTANYVAWKLCEAGVAKVYGLFLVKTMKDTDNSG